jgi:hypothetical protein
MRAAGMIRWGSVGVGALALGLLVAGPARAAIAVPGGATVEKVDFERHLMGLFGRMGCNAGSCHGSFQGKGGFRLSLFGYEPARDYVALTRDSLGRRISFVDPEHSLLLLKPTGQVSHGGGLRFSKNSWQYQMLRQWILEGAPWQAGSGAVEKVVVTPAQQSFGKVGQAQQLRVQAHFHGGDTEDITALCDFRTNDDAVADVSPEGLVRALRPGATAIVISYRGNVVPVRVLVPLELPAGFQYPKVPAVNYVDREVLDRLRRLNIVPSELADDAEFLRRVTIDTIGCLPSPAEVRAFLADARADKRTRKIDELLANPLHAALWATKLCDVTGNNTNALEQPVQLRSKRSQMWHDWLRKRFAENVPYDEIVRGILTATSREGGSPEEWLEKERAINDEAVKGFDTEAYAARDTLDLFWRRQQKVPIEQWGEKTAAAFLGIRLECAQCHKHPFDRWSQADYRSYANIFSRVAFGVSPEAKKLVDAENAALKKKAGKKKQQAVIVREVYLLPKAKGLPNPDTNKYLPARALGGPEIPMSPDEDPRATLFAWMCSPDNPFFARSFVNRIWGHYFGIGLVQPVDDFSLANPPSNDRLLDALARDFIAHKFDIRHIEKTILTARVYQLSSRTNFTNKLDNNNYSHSYVRPMMAEAVLDVIDSALGVTDNYGKDVRPGSRAVEIGPSQVQVQQLNYVLRVFGRPPRTTACDCERASEPALPQTLYLMTDPALQAKLQAPKGRLQQLLKGGKSDAEVLDELFLATLTRLPTEAERQAFARNRKRAPDRRAACADTLWALLNTREFILNH